MEDGDKYLLSVKKGGRRRPLLRPRLKVTGYAIAPGWGIRYFVEGEELVLRIDLKNPPKLSASGKSYVIANSRGPTYLALLPELEGHKDVLGEIHLITNVYRMIDAMRRKE